MGYLNEMACSALGQEMTAKVSELNAQRKMREQQIVDISLKRIADGLLWCCEYVEKLKSEHFDIDSKPLRVRVGELYF